MTRWSAWQACRYSGSSITRATPGFGFHDFVVNTDHREEGHGTELLAAVESWAREEGCEYVALAVRNGNDAAADFYADYDLEAWGIVMEREL